MLYFKDRDKRRPYLSDVAGRVEVSVSEVRGGTIE
jgi:hypothetical protein